MREALVEKQSQLEKLNIERNSLLLRLETEVSKVSLSLFLSSLYFEIE